MKVDFRGVKNEKIKKLFLDILEGYPKLHDTLIVVKRKRLKSSTMQARPLISVFNIFNRKRTYIIYIGYHIRDREDLIIANVPNKVIKGWFAHEFGHLIDYSQHSNFRMIIYGLQYLVSRKFRRKVEYDADYIAIKYGYYQEILATKEYILDHDMIDPSYKSKIEKYYMSRKEVLLCNSDDSLLEPYKHL